MNENENDFESLRHLLALKRHEVPPPGYFHNFSSQVIGRIRAGETSSADGAEGFFGQVPWLLRFLKLIEAKPAFVGTFATALCMLLVAGIVYSEQSEANPEIPAYNLASSVPLATVSPVFPAAQSPGIALTTNVNLNLQPVASLFGQQDSLGQQVSLAVPGN